MGFSGDGSGLVFFAAAGHAFGAIFCCFAKASTLTLDALCSRLTDTGVGGPTTSAAFLERRKDTVAIVWFARSTGTFVPFACTKLFGLAIFVALAWGDTMTLKTMQAMFACMPVLFAFLSFCESCFHTIPCGFLVVPAVGFVIGPCTTFFGSAFRVFGALSGALSVDTYQPALAYRLNA